MPFDSAFTTPPPHSAMTSGLGKEIEAFKSWSATTSPLFPCLCTSLVKELTCSQWCRYKMVEPVSTWFHEHQPWMCALLLLVTNAQQTILWDDLKQFIVVSHISMSWSVSSG